MTQQHLITPPLNLVRQWAADSPVHIKDENYGYELFIAHHAAEWGADEELDACCEWLMYEHDRKALRADRRPILTSTSPTDEELCELYTKAYYKSADRQGPAAQAAALRAVLERWGK
jgi:hypothetical protein